jgi:hypothetical protein
VVLADLRADMQALPTPGESDQDRAYERRKRATAKAQMALDKAER